MGYHLIPGTDQRYCLISYDDSGSERSEADGMFSTKIIEEAIAESITNVFFFCHGWKGDLAAAIDQYDHWIGALMNSADVERAGSVFPAFKPLLIGLHWPSLPWGAEAAGGDGSFSTSDNDGSSHLFNECLEKFGDTRDVRTQLEIIFNAARVDLSPDTLPQTVRDAYLRLNNALGLKSEGVSAPPDADREGFDPESAYQTSLEDGANFSAITLSGILAPLGQLSYWTMKKRARTSGEGGMHRFLKDLQLASANKPVAIHLMGHSFGTIVISGMLGGPNAIGSLPRRIDSVVLVQGAVSMWSYAKTIPFASGGSGYFHQIIADGKVSGPLVATKSRFDLAVGRLYPLASRIHGSASFDSGLPEFGGIGTYGLRGLGDDVERNISMLPVGGDYGFEPGKVYNLESSKYICKGGGASGAHSDIAGPEVAHAIWQAAFASRS